jgi:glycosyltransferase involved in cell wall biosynthesis
LRLGVYTDYTYHRDSAGVSGERAFVRFMTGLRPLVARLVLIGRLDPTPGRSHYPLEPGVEFLGLPYYTSLTRRPIKAIVSLGRSAVRFWRLLDELDTVWLLGPYIHTIGFALIALVRRRTVVLGVRQDFPIYARSRHPGARWIHLAADILEWSFRALARRLPVVVVGPDLARNYRRSRALLQLTVSLISESDLVPADLALARPRTTRVLSVGRLDTEKNPLLLADVLAALHVHDSSWQMDIAGDGPLQEALTDRLKTLELQDAAELHGYVPIDQELPALYRAADVFLHVSFTEGLPQVLFEAFAAGTPVVATAVGGVPNAAADAAILIPPDDAQAAASAIEHVHSDPELRARLVRSGYERARGHTLEGQAKRLVEFLQSAATGGH